MKISMMKSMRWITGLTGDCLADLLELPHNEDFNAFLRMMKSANGDIKYHLVYERVALVSRI
jgi:hypothetical protein